MGAVVSHGADCTSDSEIWARLVRAFQAHQCFVLPTDQAKSLVQLYHRREELIRAEHGGEPPDPVSPRLLFAKWLVDHGRLSEKLSD